MFQRPLNVTLEKTPAGASEEAGGEVAQAIHRVQSPYIAPVAFWCWPGLLSAFMDYLGLGLRTGASELSDGDGGWNGHA